MRDAYFIGLDLGQLSDYTALTVVKRVTKEEEELEPVSKAGHLVGYRPRERLVLGEYQLQHVHRFEIGTAYLDIAREVRALKESEHLRGHEAHVVADTTGVGLPVFEMLQAEGIEGLRGITITGGDSVSRDGRIHRVPKRDLATTLQVLTQGGKIRAAKGLPFKDVLFKEMQNFKVKINIATGHDSYEAWREGAHDDLVLALALACWFAEHGRSAGEFHQTNYLHNS